jgi:uncharacterized protein YegJ (DUF2314 family)
MTKLILHAVMVAVLISLGRQFGWAWWVTTPAVIAGLVCVHVVYEALFSGSRHLGAAPVSNDDPLMLAAMADAKRTWPRFVELFATHPKDSIVKFRLTTKAGDVENVWGDLLELGADTAKVYLRTLPIAETDLPSRQLTIPVADIVDWQVMFPDGSLRGGFTQQATFKIMERENGSLPRKFVEQLARYRAATGD